MPIEMLEDLPALHGHELGRYRDHDYRALPDEARCELMYGELVMTPAPLLRHQAVVGRLLRLLQDHAASHGGLALASPVDVLLFDHSVVQPDLVYVSPARLAIARRRLEGAPDLVVEVLSEASLRRDRVWKRKLYLEAGVREYWIVDPEARAIEFLAFDEGRFVDRSPGAAIFRSSAFPGLELDLASFWRELGGLLAILPG